MPSPSQLARRLAGELHGTVTGNRLVCEVRASCLIVAGVRLRVVIVRTVRDWLSWPVEASLLPLAALRWPPTRLLRGSRSSSCSAAARPAASC